MTSSTSAQQVRAEDLRRTMARFPSGVTVVTTIDACGVPRGFTASSLVSVSLDPPLVSVCVAYDAQCYPAFAECSHFAVSVLRHDHGPLARVFASKGADKFGHGPFARTPGGLPAVRDAVAVLECATFGRHPAGDHVILVGRVQHTVITDGVPLVFADQRFQPLNPVPAPGAR